MHHFKQCMHLNTRSSIIDALPDAGLSGATEVEKILRWRGWTFWGIGLPAARRTWAPAERKGEKMVLIIFVLTANDLRANYPIAPVASMYVRVGVAVDERQSPQLPSDHRSSFVRPGELRRLNSVRHKGSIVSHV